MDWLNSRPGIVPPPNNLNRSESDIDNDLPRDDLFHDPAYKTHLFEILSILQALAIEIDDDEENFCPRCKSELSSVIAATCQAWLDNEDNTDFLLNPRTRITRVKGEIADVENDPTTTPLLMITTALGYNLPEPELILEGMKVRTALEGRWFRDATERFIAHVPLPDNVAEAEKYQKEMQYKLWYLLLGKKSMTRHLVYGYDIFTFASNHFELAGFLADQEDERFCGRVDCWPYPSFDFATESPEESPEMLDNIVERMVKKIRKIILGGLESDGVLGWLKGERDVLLVLHTLGQLPSVKEQMDELREDTIKWYQDDCADWVFHWSAGCLFREGKEVTGVPMGEEDALRAYEGLRMAKIVDPALGELGFGRLLEGNEDEERVEGEEVNTDEELEMELDIDEVMEMSHSCEAGLGTNLGERYYE